jgi:hypothetical protein
MPFNVHVNYVEWLDINKCCLLILPAVCDVTIGHTCYLWTLVRSV